MPKGREDLTGRMFGRWKVIGPIVNIMIIFIGIR